MATKHHPNLVRLLGFSLGISGRRRPEQILIYELMPNGDLSQWIGKGVQSNTCTAKMSPTYLALQVCLFIQVSFSTSQYLLSPPLRSHPLQGFGIVMLEVMTGRHVATNSLVVPSDEEAGQQLHILSWVQQQLAQYGGSEAVAWLKDARMEARDELVLRVVQLALRCTAMPTAMRPAMTEIAAELDAVLVEVGGKRINSAAHQVDQEMELQSLSAPTELTHPPEVMAFRGTAVTPSSCRDPPIARFCPHAQ
ncbi:unnamed protein product [Closterium sp. NIES-65]|nr:unnamed protein product [Closterium sp. NIES-65]